MAPLTSHGDLAAAELAFFVPAFLLSVFVLFRHGISRQLGWFYITTLSILRIIGASCLLYAETQNDHSEGLLETAAITSAVGTAPLLLALLGFLERLHAGMGEGRGVNKLVFQPVHLLAILALVLAIVGGVFESENTSDTTSSKFKTGEDLMEAASILFLVIYLILAAITILTFFRLGSVAPGESKLVYAGLAALPFLLVRMIFTIVVSFSKPGSSFYFVNVDVWGEAFMQFLMEAIVVVIFITAGMLVPKQQKASRATVARKGQDVEIVSGPNADRVREMEAGRMPAQSQQQSRFQQPQRIGDYRPSKMLRNYLSSR